MLEPLRSLNSYLEKMPDDSLFFKILSPIPIIGSIIHVWKTQLLFNEFLSSHVPSSGIVTAEERESLQRSFTKLERCCTFATNTPPLWLHIAVVIATFVLSFTFASSPVANAIVALCAAAAVGQGMHGAYIASSIHDFTEELRLRTRATAIAYLDQTRTAAREYLNGEERSLLSFHQ